MAETHAEEMVRKLEAVLAANPGVETIEFDGERTHFGELEKQLNFWERKVARQAGRRPIAGTMRLDRAW